MKICKICGENKCTSNGAGKLKSVCGGCKTKPWTRNKGKCCEICGFIAVHRGQLDIDHIDGNSKNNDPSNHQTICSNCHRLKTIMNRDYESTDYVEEISPQLSMVN